MNILWLSLDKVFKLAVGLIVGIWVARYLGPNQWGELNYVLAFVTITATVAKLGMDGFLVKEILEDPLQKNEILGTSFLMRLVIIPVLFGSVLIYFKILDLNSDYYWLLAFLSFNLFITPFDLIDLDFQSRLQSKLTVVAKNIAYVLGALFRVYLLISNKSLLWFAAAMGFEAALSYILLTILYQRNNNIFQWTFNSELARKILKTGWPFTLASLAVILYMRLDQVMLGSMVDETQLGYFSSAIKISDVFLFLPMAVSSSYLPTLIEAKKTGWELFIRKNQFFINWMMRISVVFAILVTIFSDLIIQQLFGTEYMPASGILVIHIWSLIPIFLGVATSHYLVIENLQKFSLYRTLIGLIFNVLLNLYLIPRYAAFGAALATTISQLIASVFSMALFNQTRILFNMQLKSITMLFNFR
ncbi:flippase [Dyadobacter sp. CY356]|nr:flippase [Dyadobacter sp. CY356]